MIGIITIRQPPVQYKLNRKNFFQSTSLLCRL